VSTFTNPNWTVPVRCDRPAYMTEAAIERKQRILAEFRIAELERKVERLEARIDELLLELASGPVVGAA
jgi:hypothetical protein